MQRPDSFLGGLSSEAFLQDYWQQKPLLCRGALPDYMPPVTANELAGLALEQEIESRIVKRRNWELLRGPFKEALFSALGEEDWTLLIQDLEQHIPEVADLLGLLDFLPKWRIDDVMASFAAPGGSVGPHYDQYDVFLLQVEGSRRWQITHSYDPTALEASELCVLSDFQAEQEWVLHPGDLLYLPPRVAHYGVAVTPCVTYSLGCRAPSTSDIVRQFSALQIENLDESVRFLDPPALPAKLSAEPSRGQLSASTVENLKQLLRAQLEATTENVTRAFCQLVTEPKAHFAAEEPAELNAEELARALSLPTFERRKGSRWLWTELESGFRLYIDGAEWRLSHGSPDAARLLDSLCNDAIIDEIKLRRMFHQDGEPLQQLFTELVRRGELTGVEQVS